MSARVWFAPFILALTTVSFHTVATPSAAPAAQQGSATTTLDDQAELAVTIYNSDIALVRDVRNLQIARGTSDLHFMDIAATVNPATVHFRSLTEPARVSVLEQNYELRPPRSGKAAAQIRRARAHPGPPSAGWDRRGRQGAVTQLQTTGRSGRSAAKS
jgi:hypothetical protein